MFREYFIILLLGHILGDFYVQNKTMAVKKENSIKWVVFHCLCYWGVMMLIILPIMSYENVLVATVASLLHLIIDMIKFTYLLFLTKNNRKTQIIERNIFFMDQIIHIFCIILIAYATVSNNVVVQEWKVMKGFYNTVGISGTSVLSWTLTLLMIHKPANIVIQKLLMIYRPKNKDAYIIKKDNNAGRFIGTVERIIMLIFLSIGQYSSIGLVLTAKSIARYDRITKEKDFAEYYLLGTLISTLVVIVVSFIL